MAPDHAHPDSASIRELTAVKDELLLAMERMEARLTAKIETSFHAHGQEHASLDGRAAHRHGAIDEFIASMKSAEVRAEGRSSMLSTIGGVLRMLNEFRWLLAVAVAVALFLLGDVRVSFGPHP